MMPSFSMARRLSVSTFWLMPGMERSISLKRQGRESKLRKISSFHLFQIGCTVVATGQSDSFSFVSIVNTSVYECSIHK